MFRPWPWLIALVPIAVAAAAACSSAGAGHTSAGSCAPGSVAGYLAAARVVFVGTALPGPAVPAGQENVLVSPARMRVIRYLKGSGPAVVTVTTGITRADGGTVANEDGIQPQAGQQWKIYTASSHMPYQTSDCNGSAPTVGGTGPADGGSGAAVHLPARASRAPATSGAGA